MGPRYEYFKAYFARPENLEKKRKSGRKWQSKTFNHQRLIVFKILGPKCANPKCLVPGGCADIRCLQLDHIKGDGNKQRKIGAVTLFKRYVEDPELLKKNIQVLCANCNWTKVHTNKEFKPRKYK